MINRIQTEIELLHPNHIHYNDYYKVAELGYWSCIPPWIEKYIKENKVNNCIDIGCMVGTLLLYVKNLQPNCDLYACNLIKFLSNEYIEKYNVKFTDTNIELQPFPFDTKFDVIIFTEIIEHLKCNPIHTLKKIKEHLSQNGRLYLSTPDSESWGKLNKYNDYKEMPVPTNSNEFIDDLGHEYQFNKEEMYEIFAECGLEVVNFNLSSWGNYKHLNFELRIKI